MLRPYSDTIIQSIDDIIIPGNILTIFQLTYIPFFWTAVVFFLYLSRLRFYYIYIQVYILSVFNRKMKYGLTSNSSNNENAQIVQNNAQSINLSLLFHIGIVMLFIQVIQHFLTKLCVWAKGRIIISEIIVLRNLYHAEIKRRFL